jgi:serine/threonine protein kinase
MGNVLRARLDAPRAPAPSDDALSAPSHSESGEDTEPIEETDACCLDNENFALASQTMKFATAETLLEAVLWQKVQDCCGTSLGSSFPRVMPDVQNGFVVMEMFSGTLLETATVSGAVLRAVAQQLIAALQTLHRCGVLHCDVAPSNVGVRGELPHVLLFDLGCSLHLRADNGEWSFPAPAQQPFRVAYASIARHMRLFMHCIDDLEALGYVLLEKEQGCLPWSALTTEDDICRAKSELRQSLLTATGPLSVAHAYLRAAFSLPREKVAPSDVFYTPLFDSVQPVE